MFLLFYFLYFSGNMWIGWDNELQPVKIGFQFDKLRKFHQVSIHVNNLVSQGVQVKRKQGKLFNLYYVE